ncbi:HNH endonuclease signature motif containing protein [Cellulomonas sp. URHD0024]|uniref:HNH endonuclease signature motif containing protein n=1 Tax=Cellulomonas sp. URHD0024 TaxID=1302620 RepID=UPI0004893ABB|nr:HNH endonuclease signature motif containing protein [Cellulomonas sp. URHD0024]
MTGALALAGRLSAVAARAMPIVEADGWWSLEGARSVTTWVAANGRVSHGQAARLVRLGRALRDDLPVTAVEAVSGEVSIEAAHVLATVTTTPARKAALAASAQDCGEAFLVEHARELSVGQLRVLARRWASHADPDADERGYREASAREFLDLANTTDGWHLSGFLSTDHGHALTAALEAMAGRSADQAGQPAGRRRATALNNVVRTVLDRDLTGATGDHRPQLTVVTDLATLNRALAREVTDRVTARPSGCSECSGRSDGESTAIAFDSCSSSETTRGSGRDARAPEDGPLKALRSSSPRPASSEMAYDDPAQRMDVDSRHRPDVHSPLGCDVHSPLGCDVHSPLGCDVHSPLGCDVDSPPGWDAADPPHGREADSPVVIDVDRDGGQRVVDIERFSVAELIGTGPIPDSVLARLACDSQITRVVFGADSVVLNVGRAERTYTGAKRRAIIARDRFCQFPGCSAPPAMSEVHHTDHWLRDRGETNVQTGALICWHHHQVVHDRGIEVCRGAGGRWRFVDRHGRDLVTAVG